MFNKPKKLEGLSPTTKVVIQVSLEPLQPGLVEVASITVNTSDFESSPPKSKSRRSKKDKKNVNYTFNKSETSISVKVKNPIKNKKNLNYNIIHSIKYSENSK